MSEYATSQDASTLWVTVGDRGVGSALDDRTGLDGRDSSIVDVSTLIFDNLKGAKS